MGANLAQTSEKGETGGTSEAGEIIMSGMSQRVTITVQNSENLGLRAPPHRGLAYGANSSHERRVGGKDIASNPG